MTKKHTRKLKTAMLAAGLVVGVSGVAYATYPVIDTAAIAKLADQLSRMQQQIDQLKKHTEWFTQMSQQLQDQIDAIGEMGQLTLPSLNLDRLGQDVMRNVQCLQPDLEEMMPGVDLDDLEFGSICEGRQVYRDTLWADPEDLTAGGTWESKAEARAKVQARREALIKETATSALAQGDLAATEQAETNQRATEELEGAVNAAKTQNDRLAAIAQGQVLTNRQLVQQNQLLAQLVKIQATMLIVATSPVNERPALSIDEDGAQE